MWCILTHKLEGIRGLRFKHYCQKWTFQGHRQSRTYTGKVVISGKRC